MPKVGDKEFPYTPKGIQKASKESSKSGIPVSDAGNRTESYQLGGQVGQPGFGQRPMVNRPVSPMKPRNAGNNQTEHGGLLPPLPWENQHIYDEWEEGGKVSKIPGKPKMKWATKVDKPKKKITGEKGLYKKGTEGGKQQAVDKLAAKRDAAKKSGNVRKYKRLQNRLNKRLGKKASTESGKHTKASAAKVIKKHKEGESWKKASAAAKKNKVTGGASMSELVKARSLHKKGTPAYKNIQNQINKNYGVKKRH